MEQQKLNPVLVYVLAILALPCCCFGGAGILLAGPAFLIAQSNLKKAANNPESYEQASVKTMNTAKIVALVVLIINVLYLLWTVYRIYTIGWDEIMEESQRMMEEFQKNQ